MSTGTLPPAAFKAQIKVEKSLPSVASGQQVCHRVRIKNVSSYIWAGEGENEINLSYRWLDEAGNPLAGEGLRTPLPGVIQPGQEVAMQCVIEAPDRPGQHHLELDLVQENVAWFRAHGSEACKVPCKILPARKTQPLKWTGKCSEAEFHAACATQDWWYHSYYFDNGFGVAGDFDISKDVDDYGFPRDMKGMRVLDIGTASGWFAVYFAQKGADVTAVDVRGMCDYDFPDYWQPPTLQAEKPNGPDATGPDGKPVYFSRVSKCLWIMNELLGTRVRLVNSKVYDLTPEMFGGKKFDLVFLGSILMHLRDPIGALLAARKVCSNRVIATINPMFEENDNPQPRARMVDHNWWYPNKACFRRWLNDAGFKNIDVERTLTLTADKLMESYDQPGVIRNRTQILQVGDATI